MQKLGLGSLLLLVLVHIPTQAQAYKITSGNAVDLGSYWAEITTAALAPGENPHCPEGRLFFAAGHGVLATDLKGNAVAWPNPAESPNPRLFGYIETVPPSVIWDGHLVKLKDGSLLLTAEGITWNDNVPDPKPDWWGRTAEFPLKNRLAAGGRANIYVHRSEDCGRTWTRATDVDAAMLVVADPSSGAPTTGLCGTPRLFEGKRTVTVNGPGGMKGEVLETFLFHEGGGWDGHFLYADPYNGNLFLSTPCYYGTGKLNEARALVLLVMSSDRGDSWKVIGQIDTQKESVHSWRMPVTSLPTGQVALAYLNSPKTEVKLAVFSPPYDKVSLLGGKSLTALTPGSHDRANVRTIIPGYVTLAGLPGKGFLVSTPHWQVLPSGKKQVQRTFEVRRIPAPLPGQGPVELPRIEGPRLADVIHGTLVEGRPATDLHAVYWVERYPVTQTVGRPVHSRFRVKYQVFKGSVPLLKQPGELTIANGQPYTYEPGQVNKADSLAPFIGDYMSGASYAGKDGSQHFVVAWSEQGRLRFNTITVTPPALSADAPKPVDPQIDAKPVPVQRISRPSPKETAAEPVRKAGN